MSYIKIQNKLSGGNKSSSSKAVKYLEKENKILTKQGKPMEYFFNAKKADVKAPDVIKNLDSKRAGLKKTQDKFFSIILSPSSKELEHLSDQDLKDATKDIMAQYAQNFNRNIDPNDLVWYAKLEKTRKRKGYKLKEGQKSGEFKPGDQRHVHILIRRNTKKGVSLSPMANARNTKTFGKNQQVGFDRLKYAALAENIVRNKIKAKGQSLQEPSLTTRHLQKIDKENQHLSVDERLEIFNRYPIYRRLVAKEKETRRQKAAAKPKINKLQVALDFHTQNQYPGKMKNLSYDAVTSGNLNKALKKKYGFTLSVEEIKKIHSHIRTHSKSKGKRR